MDSFKEKKEHDSGFDDSFQGDGKCQPSKRHPTHLREPNWEGDSKQDVLSHGSGTDHRGSFSVVQGEEGAYENVKNSVSNQLKGVPHQRPRDHPGGLCGEISALEKGLIRGSLRLFLTSRILVNRSRPGRRPARYLRKGRMQPGAG